MIQPLRPQQVGFATRLHTKWTTPEFQRPRGAEFVDAGYRRDTLESQRLRLVFSFEGDVRQPGEGRHLPTRL